jgi:hypothetical protein
VWCTCEDSRILSVRSGLVTGYYNASYSVRRPFRSCAAKILWEAVLFNMESMILNDERTTAWHRRTGLSSVSDKQQPRGHLRQH